jgi:hypothetical protein
MNLFRTTTAAFVVAASLATAGSASAFERWIDIHNVGDSNIVAVRISDVGRDDWGYNLLRGVIPVNGVRELEPARSRGYCRFDVQVTYADGNSWDIYDVNLCEATDIVTDGPSYEVYSI